MTRTKYLLFIALCIPSAGIPLRGNTGIVRKVLRGDLIQIGDSFVARLTGISAPSRDAELGPEVYEFTRSELEGRRVRLSTWTTDNSAAGIVYDKDGRPFVQIYYGEGLTVSFNELLLKKGYARVDHDYLPDELEHFIDLEREARLKGIGIWRRDSAESVFLIPRIEGLEVDGSGGDWDGRGFHVGLVTEPDGRVSPPDDFDARFRLGWNDAGLFVLADIRDDVVDEHESASGLWIKDCVELFVAEHRGSMSRYQVVIAPGADTLHPKPRWKIYDWRDAAERAPELTAHAASRVLEGGYRIEALLPWRNLGISPRRGLELAFQFLANDADPGEDSRRVAWYPGIGPTDPKNLHRVRLADAPSESILCRVDRQITLGGCSVSVLASGELNGKSVTLRSGSAVIGRGELNLKHGRPRFELEVHSLHHPNEWPTVQVEVDGKAAASYEAIATLDQVIERYIEASGGRAALAKLKTRVCAGRYVDDLSGQPARSYPLQAYAEVPDRWTTIAQSPKGRLQNGFDGRLGYRVDSDRIESDNRMAQSWLGFLLNPHGALHLQDYFPAMLLEGKEVMAGRSVYLVKTVGAPNRLYFDADSGLLMRIGPHWKLQNYREVDGVRLPFRVAASREGGESYYAFDSIEHNLIIDNSRFAVPDAGDVFADAFADIDDPMVAPMLKMQDLTYKHGEMNIPCRDGRFLYDLVIREGYTRGLEIGTYNGYSTLWLALALRETGGRLVTLEVDAATGEEARRNFRKAGLEAVIDSRICDALKEIPKISGNFDFVFIDAWKPDYLQYLHLLRDRMLPGGAIVAHNVTNHARDMREFLEAIRNDSSLETTFHRISAEGFSLSIKRK